MPDSSNADMSMGNSDLMTQWKTALEVYRHHFDLFLKAVALYFAIVGALAGFIYRDNMPLASQKSLSILISLLSVVSLLGCWLSRRYVKTLQALVGSLARELHIQDFPFTGALNITSLFAWTSGALAIIALLNAFWFIR